MIHVHFDINLHMITFDKIVTTQDCISFTMNINEYNYDVTYPK